MSSYERYNNQSIEIDLIPSSELIEIAYRWQSLEQKIGNKGLTNSWTWIKTWLDNHDDVVQYTFAFGRQDNRHIGAALITKATYRIKGIPIPSVYLGTAGEPAEETTHVQYNRLLVAPESLDAFATGLICTLRDKFCWSELRLNGFIPEHAGALIRACTIAGLNFNIDQRKSPAFDFQKAADEGYQDFISAFGNNTRYNIRRSMRLFDKTFGKLRTEWAETQEQAKNILRELITLHQERWEHIGALGAFQSDRLRQYHEDLIDTLSLWPHGSLIVFRVKHGEKTIGCLFNFVDEDGHVMSYKSGLSLFEDNRLKPGLVTHTVCMEECKRLGLLQEKRCRQSGFPEEECGKQLLLRYDFLTGEALYKAQLSNTESDLIWITAQRGMRMWLIKKARNLLKFVKNIKASVCSVNNR